MARLTNRQMDVLADRVTDLLQEEHDKTYSKIINSSAYVNFEVSYKDDTVEEIKKLIQEKNRIEAEQAKINEKKRKICENLFGSAWFTLEDMLKKYLGQKKKEKFPDVEFNREKTLRRVQADILLSDVTNPDELVNSLVEKLK